MASANSSVLARTYGAGRGRRRTIADRIGLLFVGALGVIGAVFGGGEVYDRLRREAVRPQMLHSWAHAQQVLVRRLHQSDPLEFGAVWATHAGMICGLVNGRHSFSGLAGMTPFAVDGEHTVFALDQTALDFAPFLARLHDRSVDQARRWLDAGRRLRHPARPAALRDHRVIPAQ